MLFIKVTINLEPHIILISPRLSSGLLKLQVSWCVVILHGECPWMPRVLVFQSTLEQTHALGRVWSFTPQLHAETKLSSFVQSNTWLDWISQPPCHEPRQGVPLAARLAHIRIVSVLVFSIRAHTPTKTGKSACLSTNSLQVLDHFSYLKVIFCRQAIVLNRPM